MTALQATIVKYLLPCRRVTLRSVDQKTSCALLRQNGISRRKFWVVSSRKKQEKAIRFQPCPRHTLRPILSSLLYAAWRSFYDCVNVPFGAHMIREVWAICFGETSYAVWFLMSFRWGCEGMKWLNLTQIVRKVFWNSLWPNVMFFTTWYSKHCLNYLIVQHLYIFKFPWQTKSNKLTVWKRYEVCEFHKI